MKQHEMVILSKGTTSFMDRDLLQTEKVIADMMSKGYVLQQILSPDVPGGATIGIFCKA